MAAANYDFEIEQGSTFTQSLIYRDDNGDPVDLTGIGARMQIRASVKSPTVLSELTTDNGRITIDPLIGKVTLNLTATETAMFTWRKGAYDLELVIDADNADRLLQGTIAVSPEVTR